jgi:hypothetical protein
VSLGVFLEPLYGFIYEVILLQLFCCIFLLALFHLENQAKYFAWDRLVVVLLLIFVGYF